MAIFNSDDIKVAQGKLTKEQIERISKIASQRAKSNNLMEDMEEGIVTPEQLANAILNTKNVRFLKSPNSSVQKVKIQFENGLVKEYEIYSVVTVMQKYIDIKVLEPLSSFRLAYLRKYDPDFKMPEGANVSEIDNADNIIDNTTDEKMKDDGIPAEDKEKRADIRKHVNERFIVEAFMNAVLMLNSYGKTFKTSSIEAKVTRYVNGILDLCVQMAEECNWVDDEMKRLCLSMAFRKQSSDLTVMSQTLGLKPLTDEDVIRYLEKFITREEFEKFISEVGDCLIDRKSVVKYFTSQAKGADDHSKAGMFTFEEFKQKISKSYLIDMYKYTKNREVLQYMLPDQIMTVYAEGLIEDRDLRRYVKLSDILDSSLDAKTKMDILTRSGKNTVFAVKESEKIWQLYENGEFSANDIKALENVGYFSIESIIKQYIENSKRKIAEELGELPQISEEKLLEYFTPDVILRKLGEKLDDDVLDFYKNKLRELYQNYETDMDDELSNYLLNHSGLSEKQIAEKGFLLYKNGIMGIDILRKLNVSKEDIVDYCEKHKKDEKLLIDVFNAELVSQDDIIEILGDDFEESAFDLIGKGMSSRIIAGYYATSQLIEMTRATFNEEGTEISAKLTYENLSEIRSDIEIGIDSNGMTKKGKSSTTLLDLYLSDRLSYSELYDLVKADVISIDVANMINEKYNLIKDWDKLKEKGVEGKSILDMTNVLPAANTTSSGDVVGIDEGCIIDFYIAMGAKEYLEIDPKQCPVFKDYMIIPIIEKKVAYLESEDGRTYIVPLKIVLEQINNPNGQMDLIGNARSRKEFNRQKAHIRSVNHTRNWGRKVVQKTAELPSVPMTKDEAKEFIKTHFGIIRAIENSYDTRKLAITKQNNTHQNP